MWGNLLGLALMMLGQSGLGFLEATQQGKLQANALREQGLLQKELTERQIKAQGILQDKLSAQEERARQHVEALHQQRRSEQMSDTVSMSMIQSLLGGGNKMGVDYGALQAGNMNQTGMPFNPLSR